MSQIVRSVCARIMAHAKMEAPHECCGLLAGRENQITAVFPIPNLPSDDPRIAHLNISADRRLRYMMDPQEQIQAMKHIRNTGLTLMGIYHSHPASPAYPSETDVRLAFYPDVLYVIVSLAGSEPALKAFWIVDCAISEKIIEII